MIAYRLRHLNPNSDGCGHKNTSFILRFRRIFRRRTFPFENTSNRNINPGSFLVIIWWEKWSTQASRQEDAICAVRVCNPNYINIVEVTDEPAGRIKVLRSCLRRKHLLNHPSDTHEHAYWHSADQK